MWSEKFKSRNKFQQWRSENSISINEEILFFVSGIREKKHRCFICYLIKKIFCSVQNVIYESVYMNSIKSTVRLWGMWKKSFHAKSIQCLFLKPSPLCLLWAFFPPIITDHCIILICSGYETDELRSCCICGSLCIWVHCVKSCCMTPANICCNSNKVNLAHVLVQFALAHFAAI